MKLKLIILFNVCIKLIFAQSITPSVINSAGRTSTANINSQTIIYTDNIGETIITTGNNGTRMLTQGFLQPLVSPLGAGTVTTFWSDVTCADKGDGAIRINITDQHPNSDVKYYWIPDTLCPTHDCSRLDSLSKGVFTVITVITYTPQGGAAKTESTTSIVEIKDVNGPCNIKVYTGISLSSGSNTKFVIDNIELFPKATVSIYSRWGNQIFSTEGYDNTSNYWPKKDEKVLPGTYYFVIDMGEKGVIKKWLEIFE